MWFPKDVKCNLESLLWNSAAGLWFNRGPYKVYPHIRIIQLNHTHIPCCLKKMIQFILIKSPVFNYQNIFVISQLLSSVIAGYVFVTVLLVHASFIISRSLNKENMFIFGEQSYQVCESFFLLVIFLKFVLVMP